AEEFEETFEGLTGEQRLAGSVVGGFVTPWLGRSDNGQGWAGNGQMYLSVELEWAEFESVSDDETGIYVELADGTTVRQHDPASYLSSPFRENPVFLIPADSETVTVVLEPQVTVGIEDEALTWDGPAAELSITAASAYPPARPRALRSRESSARACDGSTARAVSRTRSAADRGGSTR